MRKRAVIVSRRRKRLLVSAGGGGEVAPDWEENFSDYADTADLLSYRTEGTDGAGANAGNRHWNAYGYTQHPLGARARVELVELVPAYAGLTQAMRSDYDDVSGEALSDQQANMGVHYGSAPPGYTAATHVWAEEVLRFDGTWITEMGIGSPNAADHKTSLDFCTSGRYETKIGVFGTVISVGDPTNGETIFPLGNTFFAYPGGVNPFQISGVPHVDRHPAVKASTYWTGQPFRLRKEIAIGADVPFRVWLENPGNPGQFWLVHAVEIASQLNTLLFRYCGSNRNQGTLPAMGFERIRARVWYNDPGWDTTLLGNE